MIIIRTWEEYKNGMAIAIFNCVANSASDIGNQNVWLQCASELSAEMIPSKTIFDLMECEIAEILYRASVSLTSFWTPLLDVVYNSIGYPSDGYYAKGVDDLHHVQARPFEAAFTTVLTAYMGILYYPVHVFADCGRDLIDMLNAFRSGTIDIFAVRKYRYTVAINVIRSVILFFRDGIIAITEFARVADTVDNYRKQVALDPTADPKLPSSSFVEAQRTITSLVSLIQDIANLLSEEFMRGVEAFFDCLFSLMNALMTFEADDMVKFFEKLVEELAKVLSSVVEGIFKMLIAPFEGPIPNPFRFMFCDVMGALKDGTCEFLQAKFIPKSFQFECMSTKTYDGPDGEKLPGKCSWIPSILNNEIPFFITSTLVDGITTGAVDKSDENTGESGWYDGDTDMSRITARPSAVIFTPGDAEGVNGIGTSAAEAYT